eukprot:10053004-Ditylum_brightwellii.AAC.1
MPSHHSLCNPPALYQCDAASNYPPTNIPDCDIICAVHRLILHLLSVFKISFVWSEVEGHDQNGTAQQCL